MRDTFNLLAEGVVKLMLALAAVERVAVEEWAQARGYERYLASSIKGEAAIDWSDKGARKALLTGIVADADRLLGLSRLAQEGMPEGDSDRQRIVEAAELLGRLLLQDIERKSGDGDDGVSLKGGVSNERVTSMHDPETLRRTQGGHRGGHRHPTDHRCGGVAWQHCGQPGGAGTGGGERGQHRCAGAGGHERHRLWGRRGPPSLRRRGPQAGSPGARPPDRQRFPKDDFVIDLAAGSCTCPAGQVTHNIVPAGKRTDGKGRVHHLRAFQFDGSECVPCPLRSQCISPKGRKGRGVLIHPQEALLQQARALQRSAGYDEYRARRVVVEHRLARLVQLGIRQSRYFGRAKTKFQLYLAATVANLTLVAGKLGLGDGNGSVPSAPCATLARNASLGVHFNAVWRRSIWPLTLLTSALLTQLHFQTRAFRPDF